MNKMLQELKGILEDEKTTHELRTNLINDIVKLNNSKVRVYYNFSIQDFTNLVTGSSSLEELQEVIKNLDGRKQYSIYTKESLNDFLDYLLNDEEEEEGQNLFNDIQQNKQQINDNLYIVCIGDLKRTSWL